MNVTPIRFAATQHPHFGNAQPPQPKAPQEPLKPVQTAPEEKKGIFKRIQEKINWSQRPLWQKLAISAGAGAVGFFALPALPFIAPTIALGGAGALGGLTAGVTASSSVAGAAVGAASPTLISKIKGGLKRLFGRK